MLDYIDASGARVQDERVCDARDKDPVCEPLMVQSLAGGWFKDAAGQVLTTPQTCARPTTVSPDSSEPSPYVWKGSDGTLLNFWPMYAGLDHSWYLQVRGAPQALALPGSGVCHLTRRGQGSWRHGAALRWLGCRMAGLLHLRTAAATLTL